MTGISFDISVSQFSTMLSQRLLTNAEDKTSFTIVSAGRWLIVSAFVLFLKVIKLTHLGNAHSPRMWCPHSSRLKLNQCTRWLFQSSLTSCVLEFLCSFGNSIVGSSCFSYAVILPQYR